MNARAEIAVIAVGLARGQTLGGQNCPFCNGGRTKEKSFSITKLHSGTIMFMCHRAKCKRSGRIGGGQFVVGQPENVQEWSPRLYDRPTQKPTRELINWFQDRFGFESDEIVERHQILEDIETGRAVVPVYGPYGSRRGVELRIWGRIERRNKTDHFKEIDEPWLGWFFWDDVLNAQGSKQPLVLVEDVISAMKVCRLFDCVALMGSHLTMDDIEEIMRVNENIVLCLDRDATKRAIELKARFAYIAPHLRIVPLLRDLKYESNDDIFKMISV